MNGASTENDTTNDVGSLFSELDATSWGAIDSTTTEAANPRLYFYNGVLETTIRNTGNNDALVEAYYIRGRRPLPTTWSTPVQVYRDGFKKQPIAQNPDTLAPVTGAQDLPLDAYMVGTTPFQNSVFTRHFLIYKRQKFRIPPGNEVNIVIRDSKFRSFSMFETKVRSMDKRYHGVLFQIQGPPDSVDPPTPSLSTSLSIMGVRRYRVKLMKDQMTRDVFDGRTT